LQPSIAIGLLEEKGNGQSVFIDIRSRTTATRCMLRRFDKTKALTRIGFQ
jgi:hypothetical protein